jgi:DNA-directed RNA polymerase specialized sigma24 family protein
MKEPSKEISQQGPDPVPPFWIRPEDHRGQPVDSRVLDASHRLWPWAYRHVQRELRDGAYAAELLEQVAMDVSSRLHLEPAVARNLRGYLITAFHHRVRWERLKNSRLAYEGLLPDLDGKYQLSVRDWPAAIESELVLRFLISYLPHELRHTLHYRMLGFSWKQIGGFIGISAKQAKSRFYYGVQKAYEVLVDDQTKHADRKERL